MSEGQPKSTFEFRKYGLTPSAKKAQEDELNASRYLPPKEMHAFWKLYHDLAGEIALGRQKEQCLEEMGGKIREGATLEDIDAAIKLGKESADWDFDDNPGAIASELQCVVIFPK